MTLGQPNTEQAPRAMERKRRIILPPHGFCRSITTLLSFSRRKRRRRRDKKAWHSDYEVEELGRWCTELRRAQRVARGRTNAYRGKMAMFHGCILHQSLRACPRWVSWYRTKCPLLNTKQDKQDKQDTHAMPPLARRKMPDTACQGPTTHLRPAAPSTKSQNLRAPENPPYLSIPLVLRLVSVPFLMIAINDRSPTPLPLNLIQQTALDKFPLLPQIDHRPFRP